MPVNWYKFIFYNTSCYYLLVSLYNTLSSICTTSAVVTLSFISQYQLLLTRVSFHNNTCYYLEFYFTTSAVFICEFRCTIERLRFPTCTCTGITGITEISCILHHQFLPLKESSHSHNMWCDVYT